MSKHWPNNVERLLVYPGVDCACCAGRFGFEHGLKAIFEAHPKRTRKDIMNLNPLFIRRLPSARHQEVHVENMMIAIGPELPKLFKRWCKHLQAYPEMPYMLHFILTTADNRSLQLTPEVLARCKKASPYKYESSEPFQSAGFVLKRRSASPEVLQEVLRNFANMLHRPVSNDPNLDAYFPQAMATLSDQLSALKRLSRVRTDLAPPPDNASHHEEDQYRNASRYAPTILDRAFREIAETILPTLMRAAIAGPERGRDKQIQSILSDFFAAGGSYKESRFNIAELLFDVEPELLIFLDEYRGKLNGASVSSLEDNLNEVRRTVETHRANTAARRNRERTERLQRQEADLVRQQEHRIIEAERAEHRAAVQAARRETLLDITQRFSTLDPAARMGAIASQVGYAPANFPSDWANQFTGIHIAELNATTVDILIARTRGVQRGAWKNLHMQLVEFDASNSD